MELLTLIVALVMGALFLVGLGEVCARLAERADIRWKGAQHGLAPRLARRSLLGTFLVALCADAALVMWLLARFIER